MLIDTKRSKSKPDYFPFFIGFIAAISYFRILFLNDVFMDDHCWVQVIFTSNNIIDFLDAGALLLRRVPQGVAFYPIWMLFKNTDHAFIIVHLITIVIQIITPVFLYLLIYNLFKNKMTAFIIAAILLIYPIDTTVPVITILPYRLGLMFSIISFYLTQRALAENIRWFYLIIAVLISTVSHVFLVESTIALEPGRLFMIGLILYNKGYKKNEIIINSLKYWSPFLLICIPVVLYKLFYKPYGIYEGTYNTDVLLLLDWKFHARYLAMLLGGNWFYLLVKIKYLSYWSVISGLIVFFSTYFMLKKYAFKSGFVVNGQFDNFSLSEEKGSKTSFNIIIMFGLLLLIPVVILYEVAGRKMGVGFDSRHGCLMQFGHALIFGGLICIIVNILFKTLKLKKQIITLLMASLLGLGAFFINLNLDQYFKIWDLEKQFYSAFLERFPSLPENSNFMFDFQIKIPLGVKVIHYEAEHVINMLYAESKRPEEFRKHKVTERYVNNYQNEYPDIFEETAHHGKDIYITKELIVIRWQPGEFLVNSEIVKKYPQIVYKSIADKDFPLLPPVSSYPLREKMNSFFGK